MKDFFKYYADGYRNWRLDRYLGLKASVIALTYPQDGLPGYSTGYYDGYHGLAAHV